MRIGSLFSGIGGLERGLEMAGVGRVVWQVEREPFCRDVLAKHWPEAVRYDDVCTVGAGILAPVDVVCGGFPCQDVSVAGAGAGLAGARSGLWREYARIVGELRPRFVVVENVPGLIRRGLDVVVGDLCDLGYAVEGTRIRASDVGAPHRRERVFLLARRVADADGDGGVERRPARPGEWSAAVDDSRRREGVANTDGEGQRQPRGVVAVERGWARDGGAGVAEPTSERRPGPGGERDGARLGAAVGGVSVGDASGGGRATAPECARPSASADGVGAGVGGPRGHAQPRLGRGANGAADWLDATRWPAGRGAGQHDWESPRTIAARSVPQRGARVKALGNAVVSQCAYVVGRRLLEVSA